jgi:hypothetical protein
VAQNQLYIEENIEAIELGGIRIGGCPAKSHRSLANR